MTQMKYVICVLSQTLLMQACQVIRLDQSSPLGYERKHAALCGAGYFREARDAFETMLSKMLESPDSETRSKRHDIVPVAIRSSCITELSRRYVKPARIEEAIRMAIQDAIRESPPMLINTDSGRLLDKHGQESSFESQPIFHELVSSICTSIDHARIKQEIAHYYRYATFSHKWEKNEPSFQEVVKAIVYKLKVTPTHHKLQMFCKTVRDAGLLWAWSDTCCINKAESPVLQEALVSMFRWYQASTLTIVFLFDVYAPGGLERSAWNTRAWTFQEYHASKVVRFYNKDWSLYRNLDVPNHKESPEIIAEMEAATGIQAGILMAVRPGLQDIRLKLRLASTRQTTKVEDAAYSLLGIFSLSMPVVYGEGDKALGQLLAQLLMSSGDTSIIAWTGASGSFNSCLPASTTVFKHPPTSHIPLAVTNAEMDTTIAGSRSTLSKVTRLCDRLYQLPMPDFAGKRMKLPCIAFELEKLFVSSVSPRMFRAQTAALGDVEIRAKEDLSKLLPLYLIHPWIDFLLDRQPVGSTFQTMHKDTVTSGRSATYPADTASPRAHSPLRRRSDKEMPSIAYGILGRLRQPFGALLLTPDTGNVKAYRRVAAESLITVRISSITPAILDKLADSIYVLDVL